jgi:hypothetical protein
LQDGVPIAALEAGEIRSLTDASSLSHSTIEQALKIGKMSAQLRPIYA